MRIQRTKGEDTTQYQHNSIWPKYPLFLRLFTVYIWMACVALFLNFAVQFTQTRAHKNTLLEKEHIIMI